MPILAAVLVLVAGVAAVGVVATNARATTPSCSQVVDVDEFREAAAIEAMNRTGEATVSKANTEVTIRDATGFIRLNARNPNGYCVKYVVEISEEIVAPADLGTITSNDESVEASWRASQNLSNGALYTRVEFTLPAGSNATFAPSTVRVQSLAWTGTAKQKATGAASVLQDLGLEELLGDEKLQEKTYTIEPTESSSRITVPLRNGSREIEEWQASYTLEGETRPVGQDASAPVYYTESEGAVTFHFNEKAVAKDATVRFTAEPSTLDKLRFSAEGYFSGTPFDGVLEDVLGANGVTATV